MPEPTLSPPTDFPVEVVRRALAEARRTLDMDVACFAELTATHVVLRTLDGDAAGFGWHEGQSLTLDASDRARSEAGAYLGVPVHHADGQLFGTFFCANRDPRPDLDDRDTRLLAALAGVVASQLEHEHRYHQVLESAQEPVWVTDLAGHTVFANEPLARLLDTPRASLAGRSAFEFVEPAQADRLRAALNGLGAGGLERFELSLLRPEGRPVPVEVSSAPLTDDDGVVIGAVSTLTDLTERKEAERLSDARFRWLADLVPQQVWIADAEGNLIFVNARLTEYFGADADLAGADWRSFVHPEDLDAVVEDADQRATGEAYEFVARLRRHDGEYREHVARGYPAFDDDGRLTRWYGITTDLTDERAQERLLESEHRLREAQRIAAIGSFEWHAQRQAMVFSEELLRLLEMTAEEFGGRIDAFMNRVHPDDFDRVLEVTREAATTGEPFVYDARVVLPSGTARIVNVRGRAANTGDADPAILRGTIQDVTEQRTTEAAAHGRLEAERANRAKSEFLSRMSHELRTPLNAILGFGQLLELDPLSQEQRESVGYILTAGAHLLELINEVLEISRIEAGAVRLSVEPVPVVDTLGDVADLVAPLAAERDVQVAVDGGADPDLHVQADLQRFKQILLNLLSNAIKYNRVGGLVTVRVRPVFAGRVRIVVSDTGRGLDTDQLERLFSPFERLDAADGGTEGTGLGLALSRSLAEAMGAELTAASEPGFGCDFTLELDTATPAPQDAHSPVPDAVDAEPRPSTPSARRPRVLCVEDNPSNLLLIQRILARAGVDVIEAPEGRLGIELARRHLPDLVLLDLDLPDMSGEVVLSILTADPLTAAIPIYICSADATGASRERLVGAGARGYLTKPIDIDGLLKMVSRSTDGVLS